VSTDRLRLEPLFEAVARTDQVTEIAGTPRGTLRIAEFSRFDCKGERFAGTLNPTSAAEWVATAADGTSTAEGRIALTTTDGDVYMRYVSRWDAGREGVAPPRVVAFFEAGGDLAWLNMVVAAGTVSIEGDERRYRLFQLAVGPDRGGTEEQGCRLEPLFTLDNTVDVNSAISLAGASCGMRAIGPVRAADLQGDGFRGRLHGNAAGDWASVSAGRTVSIDVIETLRTHDDALIYFNYRGSTDASGGTYTTPSYVAGFLDTGDPRYTWLNSVLAIGEGRHEVPEVVMYHFYELRGA
jgi:hypothetical protein